MNSSLRMNEIAVIVCRYSKSNRDTSPLPWKTNTPVLTVWPLVASLRSYSQQSIYFRSRKNCRGPSIIQENNTTISGWQWSIEKLCGVCLVLWCWLCFESAQHVGKKMFWLILALFLIWDKRPRRKQGRCFPNKNPYFYLKDWIRGAVWNISFYGGNEKGDTDYPFLQEQ